MVWTGIAILTAILSFLVYKHSPTTWQQRGMELNNVPLWKWMVQGLSGAKTKANDDAPPAAEAAPEDRHEGGSEGRESRSEPIEEITAEADVSSRAESHEEADSHGELPSADSTPKAKPAASKAMTTVPELSLENPSVAQADSLEDIEFSVNAPPPSMTMSTQVDGRATLQSPQRQQPSTLVPPPPRPATVKKSYSSSITPTAVASSSLTPPKAPGLMPPPPRPSSTLPLRSTPSSATSLRAPVNRNLTASHLTPTRGPSRISRSVPLAPGHSPLDWAALTSNPANSQMLRGSDVPETSYLRVTPSMLAAHNGRKGNNAWTSFRGKVYNITPYLPFHPGGKGELLRCAGKDAGRLFNEVHPWVNWDGMLGECLVGIVVSENDAFANIMESKWEEMD